MLEIADRVIDGIKTVREISKRIQDAELHNQIADLITNTADLKMEIAELKSAIIELREENNTLQRKKTLREKMKVQNRLLYLNEDVPGYNQGPFCPLCFEKDTLVINLGGPYPPTQCWCCPNCKNSFVN